MGDLLELFTNLFPSRYVTEPQAWHMFVSYIICSWLCCCIVLFANKALPAISNAGMFLIIAGVFVTILVCAIMPHVTGRGYASDDFVWRDWENQTGYSSNGFIFVAGMLNGAYSVGNPDITSHVAEEILRPSRNIPKAVLAQMAVGFVTAITYMVALLYSIHDLPAVLDNKSTFPLAEIYRQATTSRGGALGLLIVVFLPTFITCIGCYITAGPHPLDPIPRQRNPIQRLAVTRQHHIPQPLQRHVYLRLHRDGHGLHLYRLVDGIQCARRLLRAAFVTVIHCRDPAAPPERAIRVPAGLFLHAWLYYLGP
ncbi:predicted protein [Histoplasma mississippiense (nom. inval.)]|uniref:predicted protein n=1 Tax=Ajellomyces capsulatus (strain NAm1 / WU24) TaxID=2059318 RepID=UPI000157CFCD|nr:predicted protein [Histoplasma mississippiense (nom. inval.)]EDN10801.1 predicted protein [Histoplasma mississippiense (nom. inval.)]